MVISIKKPKYSWFRVVPWARRPFVDCQQDRSLAAICSANATIVTKILNIYILNKINCKVSSRLNNLFFNRLSLDDLYTLLMTIEKCEQWNRKSESVTGKRNKWGLGLATLYIRRGLILSTVLVIPVSAL